MTAYPWSVDEIVDAFEQVLPDGERREQMSDAEVAKCLQSRSGDVAAILRGEDLDAEEDEEPATLALSKSMYSRTEVGGPERVDPEVAQRIEEAFAPGDAPDADASRIPSLSHFYADEEE